LNSPEFVTGISGQGFLADCFEVACRL